MSLINDFLEKITGLDLDGSDSQKTVTERPCSNCPSNCAIAGTACSVCEPYKKRLIDAVYHVDHLDDYYDQYEVVSTPVSTGATTHCTHCGANSADPYICEYCGSKLADAPVSSGKIQVSAASEIPNPIMEAQDIIWERYAVLVKQFGSPINNAVKSSLVKNGLISDLFSQLFSNTNEETEEESTLGAKMSEAEIREAAGLYKVSLGEYLTGLDNGKYLTLKGKKEADAQGTSAASSLTPDAIGMSGMAAIGMFAESMFAGQRRRPYRPQESRPFYRDSSFRDIPQSPQQSRPESRPSRDIPQRPESRPSTRDIPQRPQQSRPSAGSGRDVLERPAAKRPTSSHSPSQRSTPQRSGSGTFKERTPEKRRRG